MVSHCFCRCCDRLMSKASFIAGHLVDGSTNSMVGTLVGLTVHAPKTTHS